MTQEEKSLLLKDLCARLPYGVKCYIKFDDGKTFNERTLTPVMIQDFKKHSFVSFIPYFRPMSTMTPDEFEEFTNIIEHISIGKLQINIANPEAFDWLNAHHFDYRGLIEKGLALEALEGMYKLTI